ncbi:MAG: hypothetical protein ACOX3T_01920 [Bdellovibrionota bacterium]
MFFRLIKTCFLLLFVFLSYESLVKNTFEISHKSELEKVKIINSRIIKEVIETSNIKNDIKRVEGLSSKHSESFFNYSLNSVLIKGVASTLAVDNKLQLVELIEKFNKYMLILIFSLLLIWINFEFGFVSSFLSGLAILLSPVFAILSGLISCSIFSLYLPSVGLSFLLLFERLNNTYIQRQIKFFLFISIIFRLCISYRSIFFIMFSCLIIAMYHGIYYKWERNFAINRVFSFCKVMFFALVCACVMQVGIDVLLNNVSASIAFDNILNNFTFFLNLNESTASSMAGFILNKVYIYPHINCLCVFIFFILVSVVSFLFYYRVMKIHQRQFYALFLMSLSSYIMVFVSSIFEISNPKYISVIWMYPATIFTFSMLGLLISSVHYFYYLKPSMPSDLSQNEAKEGVKEEAREEAKEARE